MPANLPLDDRLIEEAVQVGQHKTKKDAVTAALKEYIDEPVACADYEEAARCFNVCRRAGVGGPTLISYCVR